MFTTHIAGTETGGYFTLGDLVYDLALALAILSVLTVGYFFIKRKRLWGIIYDSRNKQPVEMAVVRLFDQQHHKLLETRVTPKSGRYTFLAEPGEFYLEVTKEGYHFPSRIVTSNVDNEYINVYHGEVIKLGAGQSLVSPDIPVDSEGDAPIKVNRFRQITIQFFDKARLPILLLTLLAVGLLKLSGYGEAAPSGLLAPQSLFNVLMAVLPGLLLIELLLIRRGRK